MADAGFRLRVILADTEESAGKLLNLRQYFEKALDNVARVHAVGRGQLHAEFKIGRQRRLAGLGHIPALILEKKRRVGRWCIGSDGGARAGQIGTERDSAFCGAFEGKSDHGNVDEILRG